MKIQAYEDFRVNNFQVFDKVACRWNDIPGIKEKWYTTNTTTKIPSMKNGGIGRVDHYMKRSIKSIVNACVKQIVLREGEKGLHVITIELADSIMGGPNSKKKTLTVKVTV